MEEFQSILTALLRGKLHKAPFKTEEGESYRDAIKKRLDDYVRRIEGLKTNGPITGWIKGNVEEIQVVNFLLIDALDQYLKGRAGKAYDKIDELMRKPVIIENIRHLRQNLDEYLDNVAVPSSLFRVRVSESPLTKRSEIFHIPFEKRELVGTQRYSIAGLPCLYLGTSIYVCWQEMGKPDFNKLYLSHYKVGNNQERNGLFVLDFAFSLETLKSEPFEEFFDLGETDGLDRYKAYLAIWPILMCCSFNRKASDSNFNVEFVIPNLLLQWISEEKRPVIGVRYFSTKTSQLRHSKVGINYVFPPSTQAPISKGFCPGLIDLFVFSKPASWQLLETINHHITENPGWFDLNDDLETEFVKNYQATQFYLMERKMNRIMERKGLENQSS